MILTERSDEQGEEALRGRGNELGLELVELRCPKDFHEEACSRK